MTLKAKQGGEHGISAIVEIVRRSFAEFLLVPTVIIVGFLFLAFASYMADSAEVTVLSPLRDFLRSHVFANSQATSGLLEAIAGGIITLTSITISLLLIAVQQSAGSLTSQVFDQFLRRRANQVYFGTFIGLALFSLITLATVNEPFNPVFGATIAFLGTVVALYLLLLLLYTTINQMRPVEIIEAIHEHILSARDVQLGLIAKTRRASEYTGDINVPVRTEKHGYVTRIDLDAIAKTVEKRSGEVIFKVAVGHFVAYQDTIAVVVSDSRKNAEAIAGAVLAAVVLERQRDITIDPSYGIKQLETIAWTSISTSKSNPAPGILTIQCLRDVMSRWSEAEADLRPAEQPPLPIVYTDDAFIRLLETFETCAVVSSESMQHQNYIEVVRTFALMFDRIPAKWQPRAEDLILRILSVLGDLVLTAELDAALSELESALRTSGKTGTANSVGEARIKMSASVGELGSRATRANG